LETFLDSEEIGPDVLSEISRSAVVQYHAAGIEHNLTKRFIVGTDDRIERTNTWSWPLSTIGLVGGRCTGEHE
jgi:hypothetical protein